MPYLKLRDSAQLFYKDWGNKSGPTVVFSHGWPLSADAWEGQMMFLANRGMRVVAHDRRGNGRSEQTWDGNDVDTWADDLSELFEHLDLKDVMLVGHSTGGGEITRYTARHGTSRVKKLVLISASVPQVVASEAYPDGQPPSVIDGWRSAMEANRSQFFRDVPEGPFFGFNRDGAKPSQGLINNWFQQGMNTGLRAAYETTRSWEIDYSEDLKKLDIPVLYIQGDDDQIVPIKNGAYAAEKVLGDRVKLKIYKGGAHALPDTEAQAINNDLLEFLEK